MDIGVFDSGLGGLIITRALTAAMPGYSFSYLGDTRHVPYGPRSADAVYDFSRACVDWLFRRRDCALVVVACNTATFAALRRLQREYLPADFPGRRILGVIVPTLEYVAGKGYGNVGLLATSGTIASNVYGEELSKLAPGIRLYSVEAPLLVPLIENDGDRFARPVVREYLSCFRGSDIEALILGCTHYPHYRDMICEEAEAVMGRPVDIISQVDIIPASLADYLSRHPEIEERLSRDGGRFFGATDLTPAYMAQAEHMFGTPPGIIGVEI